MTRLKHLLLAQTLLMSCVAFAGDRTAFCELADKNIVARTASGLAQVSNVGDIEIICSVPARAFPTTPGDKPLSGLNVATRAYQVSLDGSEKLAPSEAHVTGGMRGFGAVPPDREGVQFYLHVPLDPADREAEAERYWAKIQDKLPQEARSEEARRRALERLQEVVYQHRVGRFRVVCRVMDGTQVLGIGIVQLEVVFKGHGTMRDRVPLGAGCHMPICGSADIRKYYLHRGWLRVGRSLLLGRRTRSDGRRNCIASAESEPGILQFAILRHYCDVGATRSPDLPQYARQWKLTPGHLVTTAS